MRETAIGIERESLQQRALGIRLQAQAQRLGRCKDIALREPRHRRGRFFARQRVVKRRAQAVDVAARLGVPAVHPKVLRRGILARAHTANDALGLRIARIPELDQAKIHQHRPPICADDDVLRFDIAVQNVALMASIQCIQQLARPGEHLMLR